MCGTLRFIHSQKFLTLFLCHLTLYRGQAHRLTQPPGIRKWVAYTESQRQMPAWPHVHRRSGRLQWGRRCRSLHPRRERRTGRVQSFEGGAAPLFFPGFGWEFYVSWPANLPKGLAFGINSASRDRVKFFREGNLLGFVLFFKIYIKPHEHQTCYFQNILI